MNREKTSHSPKGMSRKMLILLPAILTGVLLLLVGGLGVGMSIWQTNGLNEPGLQVMNEASDDSIFFMSKTSRAVGLAAMALTILITAWTVRLNRNISRILVSQRDNVNRLDRLAEQSRSIAWEVDTNGLYTHISHVAEQVIGYRPEEVIDRLHFYDLHPEDGREAFKTAAFEVFERKETFLDLENAIETKDGRTVWVSTNGHPLLNTDGTLRGYRGSDTDITDRKLTEEALRTSEERLDMAMSVANDGIWDWHLDDNTVYFDPRYYTMAGYEPNEYPASFDEFAKRVHPDDLPSTNLAIQEYLAGDREIYDVEFRFLRKGGNYMWIRGRGKVVTHDREGNPKRFVGTHIDIVERKKAEEQLLCSETKFRALYNSTSDAVILFDENGFTDCNRATLSMFGLATTEMFCSKHIGDISPARQPDGRDSIAAADARIKTAVREGGSRFEWIHKRYDTGENFPAEILLSTLNLDGKQILQATVRNITKRKQTEELLQSQVTETNRVNKLMSGREERVVEMKREVNSLRKELGRDIRYKSVSDEKAGAL